MTAPVSRRRDEREKAVKMYRMKPAQIIIFSFLVLIIVGALLLSLPAATYQDRRPGLLNTLFTSTSAVCVNGLAVTDTGKTFTLFGQVVILLLMQAGGLGVMTVMSLVLVLLGKRITLSERMVIKEALNQDHLSGLVKMILKVVEYTFIIELAGTAALALRFVPMFGAKGIFYSVFHAVSAFCNAGIDVLGPESGAYSSLSMFASDPVVILTLSALTMLGGLGFVVIANVFGRERRRKRQRLSRYAVLVLAANAALLALGLITVFAFELGNPGTLGGMDTGGKLLSGFFEAVTPRSAGFSTFDQGALRPATRLIVMLLMFVGASPAGTGSGVKTTTVAVIAVFALSGIKKGREAHMLGRRLAYDTVHRAIAILMFALLLVGISTLALLGIEGNRPEAAFTTERLVFEGVAAFGTGLSTGLTPHLSIASRALLIFTMFAGRVGLMTLVFALSSSRKVSAQISYPEERFMVG